jgi:hypothetical protein
VLLHFSSHHSKEREVDNVVGEVLNFILSVIIDLNFLF